MSDRPTPEQLEARITAAIGRITSGHACMRVPVDPTDPDVVLDACRDTIASLRSALAEAEKERDKAVSWNHGVVICREHTAEIVSWTDVERDCFVCAVKELMAALAEAEEKAAFMDSALNSAKANRIQLESALAARDAELAEAKRAVLHARNLLASAEPILKPDAPLRWYRNDAVRDGIREFLSRYEAGPIELSRPAPASAPKGSV